jgi:hypothetical protein
VHEFATQIVESVLDLDIDTAQAGQCRDQAIGNVQADVLVDHGPSHLKRGDQIAVENEGARQGGGVDRRIGCGRCGPARRPGFESQFANAGGGFRRFARCEWSRLDRASRHQDVGEEREFLIAWKNCREWRSCALPLPRHPEERAGVARRHVALVRPPVVPFDRNLEQVLIRQRQLLAACSR